jgi:glutathione S-transferase
MHLYIAYKNYSSWSLRPWLALKVAGIEFDETLLPFAHSDALDKLGEKYRIPPQVPVLVDEDHVIWDSLAIMEYIAEQYPDRQLWPQDKWLRALARSAAAEMHSGFMALRSECPMNCRSQKTKNITPDIQADLDRLQVIWEHFATMDKPEGDFLCGPFGIVDAMYAPVMWRVSGYGLKVSEDFAGWISAMKALPAMQDWLAAAQQEEWVMPQYEAMGD